MPHAKQETLTLLEPKHDLACRGGLRLFLCLVMYMDLSIVVYELCRVSIGLCLYMVLFCEMLAVTKCMTYIYDTTLL